MIPFEPKFMVGLKEIEPSLYAELRHDSGLDREWTLNRLLERLNNHVGQFRMRPSAARWLLECARYPFLRERVKTVESLLDGRAVIIIDE